jgi:hypothetical protein
MSQEKVSQFYLEENTIRIIAFEVVILTVATLLFQWKYLALFLAVDFAIRAFTYFPTPLKTIAKFLTTQFKLEPKPVFAAPKKFAAGVGFLFSLSIFILFHFQLNTAAFVVGGILLFCAVLESFFKICVGCYVYDWVVVPFVKQG